MVICNTISVELNGGTVEVFPEDIDGGSVDNCGIASMSLDKTIFGCGDIGTNTVTLTVVDLKGNSSACVTTVLVQDNTGACNCDGEILFITGNPITPDVYSVSNTLISNGRVATNTTVSFKAENEIILTDGFRVEAGGNFSAKIESCTSPNFNNSEEKFEQLKVKNNLNPIEETIKLKIQPNPFRYQTTLVFDLSKSEIVNLKIFDQSGRMLKELLKDKALTLSLIHI